MNPETTEPTTVALTDADGDTVKFELGGNDMILNVTQEEWRAAAGPFTPDAVIAAIRETAGITESGVGDRFATGKRNTPDPRWCEGGDICGQRHKSWGCTRTKGHDGEHVAHTNAYEVCHIWEDEPTQPEPDESETTNPPRAYPAEDFKHAQFARHPSGGKACREGYKDYEATWICVAGTGNIGWRSDSQMAADGWVPVTPAPTTAREAFALAVSLCHEPEGDTILKHTGCVLVSEDGWVTVMPNGYDWSTPAASFGADRLLLDPPTPKRPKGAEPIEATLLAEGVPADTARRAADRIARERATS